MHLVRTSHTSPAHLPRISQVREGLDKRVGKDLNAKLAGIAPAKPMDVHAHNAHTPCVPQDKFIHSRGVCTRARGLLGVGVGVGVDVDVDVSVVVRLHMPPSLR